jgi:hypothetical protein
MKKLFITLLSALILAGTVQAQEVSLGADVVSRYIWRGLDFGDAVSIQPGISAAFGDLEIGTWGSYALMGTGPNEVDLYASYAIGNFSIGVTDYYFPAGIVDSADSKWGALDYGDPGSHTLELMAGFSSDDFPLSVMFAVNVYNDEDNSMYAELGYAAGPVDLFVGLGNEVYTTEGEFAVINVGVSASKDIKITEDFTLPMFGALVLNPDQERTHLYVGFSF